MNLDPRRIPIHRPYPDEVPWELLPEAVAQSADRKRMRIAKLNDAVVGVYAMQPLSSLHHQITALAVAPAHRRQGLGRWLLGHAIGVCESRGARQITALCLPYPPVAADDGDHHAAIGTGGLSAFSKAASAFFSQAGFKPVESGHQLLLTPD